MNLSPDWSINEKKVSFIAGFFFAEQPGAFSFARKIADVRLGESSSDFLRQFRDVSFKTEHIRKATSAEEKFQVHASADGKPLLRSTFVKTSLSVVPFPKELGISSRDYHHCDRVSVTKRFAVRSSLSSDEIAHPSGAMKCGSSVIKNRGTGRFRGSAFPARLRNR